MLDVYDVWLYPLFHFSPCDRALGLIPSNTEGQNMKCPLYARQAENNQRKTMFYVEKADTKFYCIDYQTPIGDFITYTTASYYD